MILLIILVLVILRMTLISQRVAIIVMTDNMKVMTL